MLPVWAQETYPLDEPSDEPIEQVTSVSELADVRPGDWAFQALQTLIERYGVLGGYPDRTFRGNRPMSRYEFAAALNTVVSRVEEQLLASDAGGTVQDDVATIRQLSNFYGKELETLRSRLDTITDRATALERQQFSTTTKLNGRIDLATTDGTDSGLTVINRTRLDLITSFQGSDRLVTQLEAGNEGQDAVAEAHNRRQNLLGTTGMLADGGGIDSVGVAQGVRVRKLYYAFRPSETVEVAVGSQLPPSDFIDRNSFANQSGQNFSSSFFANNPLITQNEVDRFGGAGAAVAWNVRNNLTLRALYAAADASDPAAGLFQDRYQATLEAEYTVPNQPITVRLQYTHAEINGTQIDAAGINAEWAIRRRYGIFGIFGRLGIGRYQGFNSILAEELEFNPKTWALGVSIQNFLIPGSKAGVAVGQPFVTSRLGNATQTNIEAFFGLALSEHINLSPALLIVSNPNNRKSPTIWEWTVRVLYSF
ncbi:iron uptake porin [Myxacorys almedinensis A]|uniref:Iron uptake porin n=2 Tax=Myxacorys TaxID=2056239 RepID=A0A8J7Z066_9CYAN|nr:iron uptake porin [Myxacorys almedinensis A]